MSGPPPGFNPAASVLPDNLSARIEVVQGGGGSGAPSSGAPSSGAPSSGAPSSGSSEGAINKEKKQGEEPVSFSTADNVILAKQGLQKGGPIDAAIDGPTRIAFLEQVRAGRCGADSGEMVILHKDCWAVVQVIRALLKHGMEKQKGLLPKPHINMNASSENSEQTFETFSNSESDGLSVETISNNENSTISLNEELSESSPPSPISSENIKAPIAETIVETVEDIKVPDGEISPEPVEEIKEPAAEPNPELTEEEIQKKLQNLESQIDKEMAEEKEIKMDSRKERNQEHLDYLQEQRKILTDMNPVTPELSKERNQLVSQVNSMTAQVQERMKRHTGGQVSKKKMTRVQKLFRKATKTTRKNRK